MKILLACLNANGFGGSEMYHYELARELHQYGVDVTLFTLRSIDANDEVRIKLIELGIRQIDAHTIDTSEKFDIIVASQPSVNTFMLNQFKETPIISIIHSEIRSEDPILDPRISHYIAIRPSIADMLIKDYSISSDKVSLIYNPIDRARFKPVNKIKSNKIRGVFVGEALDPIRFQAVSHIVQNCIDNDWELLIMSDSRYDFNHPNISYTDKRWHTEELVKHVDFTAGILLGRSTLEGLCCDIPGYVYNIDVYGNIMSIDLIQPNDIVTLCDSKKVAAEHIKLYKKII